MRHFRSVITASVFLIFLPFSGCSPRMIPQSLRQTQPVTADGNLSEWNFPLRYDDKDSKSAYSISNDDRNLYICFNVADRMTQVKILRAGMEVWIDTTGRKKKDIGILYPLPPEKAMNGEGERPFTMGQRNPEEQRQRPDISALRKRFLEEQTDMKLVGFPGIDDGIMPLQNKAGIAVGVNWDSADRMAYELVIPFHTFYRPVLSPADSSKVFGLTIIIRALPTLQGTYARGMGPGGPGASGGYGGGGRGGMSPSGYGGGRMQGGNPADRQQLFVANNIRTKFQLNTK